MKIRNDARRPKQSARVAALQATMQSTFQVDFHTLRDTVPEFRDATDGQIQQAAQDAGFDIVP